MRLANVTESHIHNTILDIYQITYSERPRHIGEKREITRRKDYQADKKRQREIIRRAVQKMPQHEIRLPSPTPTSPESRTQRLNDIDQILSGETVRFHPKQEQPTAEKTPEEKRAESKSRSERHTRQTMKEFWRAHLLGHKVKFITLTFEKEPKDERLAMLFIYKCIDRLQVAEKRHVVYMGCFERGEKNGRLHFHMLLTCKYYKNEDFARRFWRQGFVKIKTPKRQKKDPYGEKVLGYVTKYITKDIDGAKLWARRWRHSQEGKLKKDTTCYKMPEGTLNTTLRAAAASGFTITNRRTFKSEQFGKICQYTLIRRNDGRGAASAPTSIIKELQKVYEDPAAIEIVDPYLRDNFGSDDDYNAAAKRWCFFTPAVEGLYFAFIKTADRMEKLIKRYCYKCIQVLGVDIHQLNSASRWAREAFDYERTQNGLETFEEFLINNIPTLQAV